MVCWRSDLSLSLKVNSWLGFCKGMCQWTCPDLCPTLSSWFQNPKYKRVVSKALKSTCSRVQNLSQLSNVIIIFAKTLSNLLKDCQTDSHLVHDDPTQCNQQEKITRLFGLIFVEDTVQDQRWLPRFYVYNSRCRGGHVVRWHRSNSTGCLRIKTRLGLDHRGTPRISTTPVPDSFDSVVFEGTVRQGWVLCQHSGKTLCGYSDVTGTVSRVAEKESVERNTGTSYISLPLWETSHGIHGDLRRPWHSDLKS